MSEVRTCPKCPPGTPAKPLTAPYFKKLSRGFSAICKDCESAYKKALLAKRRPVSQYQHLYPQFVYGSVWRFEKEGVTREIKLTGFTAGPGGYASPCRVTGQIRGKQTTVDAKFFGQTRHPRRHPSGERGGMIFAALSALAIVVAGAAYIVSRRDAEELRRARRMERYILSIEEANERLRNRVDMLLSVNNELIKEWPYH